MFYMPLSSISLLLVCLLHRGIKDNIASMVCYYLLLDLDVVVVVAAPKLVDMRGTLWNCLQYVAQYRVDIHYSVCPIAVVHL